jgi:hypothetical protein
VPPPPPPSPAACEAAILKICGACGKPSVLTLKCYEACCQQHCAQVKAAGCPKCQPDVGEWRQPGGSVPTVVARALSTDDATATRRPAAAALARRRVMAWMALTSNASDTARQLDEARRRAAAGNLTDVSPTFFGTGPNGSLVGTPDAALVRALQAAGLRVHPLVAGWGAGPRQGIAAAVEHPEAFAAAAVAMYVAMYGELFLGPQKYLRL